MDTPGTDATAAPAAPELTSAPGTEPTTAPVPKTKIENFPAFLIALANKIEPSSPLDAKLLREFANEIE